MYITIADLQWTREMCVPLYTEGKYAIESGDTEILGVLCRWVNFGQGWC